MYSPRRESVESSSFVTFQGWSDRDAHFRDGAHFMDAAYFYDQTFSYRRLSYFPFHGSFSVCEHPSEPAFILRRNERERHRVRCVNEAYARLRAHLPQEREDTRLSELKLSKLTKLTKLSKVDTLRAAVAYIKHLQSLLDLKTVDMSEQRDREEEE